MKRLAWLIAVVVFFGAGPSGAESDPTMVVGRVTEIADGELLRYDADAGEWVALVPDAPFGIDDALYTDDRARAEILIPNGTLVRLDRGTRILTLSLEERLTLLHLSEGLMRVISRPDGAEIEIQTVFGRVRTLAGGAADIALDDQGVTATAMGRMAEVRTLSGETYRIQPGESLSFSDHRVATVAAILNPSRAGGSPLTGIATFSMMGSSASLLA